MLIASIVIVTKNQLSFLEKTIPTLLKQKTKDQFEIIVVDSGSIDGAKEYVKTVKSIKLVEIPPQAFKFAHAFNLGAGKAKGKYLIRLSGDCIPQGPNWLTGIIEGFEDNNVGGVFGKYIISGKPGYTYPNFWNAERFPKVKTRYHIHIYPFVKEKMFEFTGGCCAIRRDIWEMRPFNEDLIAGEDAEYSWFLHIIGYDVVYNPKVVVLHEHKIDVIGTARAYSGLDKWNLLNNWTLVKYWVLRLLGNDIYSKMKNPFGVKGD